jgi:hypothetical protein
MIRITAEQQVVFYIYRYNISMEISIV